MGVCAPEQHVVALAHCGRNDGAEVVKLGNALPCAAPGPFSVSISVYSAVPASHPGTHASPPISRHLARVRASLSPVGIHQTCQVSQCTHHTH